MNRPRPAPAGSSNVLGVSTLTRVRLVVLVGVVTVVAGGLYFLTYVSAQNARHAQAVAIRNAQAVEIAQNHANLSDLACSIVGILPGPIKLPAANQARLRAVAVKYHCVVDPAGNVVPARKTPATPRSSTTAPRPSPPTTPARPSTRATTSARPSRAAAGRTAPRAGSAPPVAPSPSSTPAAPAPSASSSACLTLIVASVCLPKL